MYSRAYFLSDADRLRRFLYALRRVFSNMVGQRLGGSFEKAMSGDFNNARQAFS
jgi:hypothetical protein